MCCNLIVREISWIHCEIRNKCKQGIFLAATLPKSKFHRNQFSSFCVILLTIQPTDMAENLYGGQK